MMSHNMTGFCKKTWPNWKDFRDFIINLEIKIEFDSSYVLLRTLKYTFIRARMKLQPFNFEVEFYVTWTDPEK